MRFTLRTLFAAIALVCVGLGVETDRAYRQQRAVAAIVGKGGRVGYEYDGQSRGRAAAWAIRLLGRDFVDHVSCVYWAGAPLKDADLACLKRFPRLSTLSLVSTPITDEGLEHLADCPRLQLVDLRFTRVTEAGFGALRRALPTAEILRRNDAE